MKRKAWVMYYHSWFGFGFLMWIFWALVIGCIVFFVVRAASGGSRFCGPRNYRGGHYPPSYGSQAAPPPPPPDTRTGTAPWTVRDPVCGAEGHPSQAGARAEYGGKIYYFCSEACRDAFIHEPHRYVGAPVPPGHSA